jgi:hypothetical protein
MSHGVLEEGVMQHPHSSTPVAMPELAQHIDELQLHPSSSRWPASAAATNQQLHGTRKRLEFQQQESFVQQFQQQQQHRDLGENREPAVRRLESPDRVAERPLRDSQPSASQLKPYHDTSSTVVDKMIESVVSSKEADNKFISHRNFTSQFAAPHFEDSHAHVASIQPSSLPDDAEVLGWSALDISDVFDAAGQQLAEDKSA